MNELYSLSEVAARAARASGLHHVRRVHGCAAAFLAAELRVQRKASVVLVAPDPEAAKVAFEDLSAICRGLPGFLHLSEPSASRLLLPTTDATPFDPVRPTRRAELERLGAQYKVGSGAFSFVVLAAAQLLRKVLPSPFLAKHVQQVRLGQELDQSKFVALLTSVGYLHTPLVEDPGGLAVRGGLFDAWSPGDAAPVRVELDGDRVAAIRKFDPDGQRSLESLREATFIPATQLLFDTEGRGRISRIVQSLCDEVGLPTRQTNALIGELLQGRVFFGKEGWLPAFSELRSLLEEIPDDAAVVVEEPERVAQVMRAELDEAQVAFQRVSDQPRFSVSALYESEQGVIAGLQRRCTLVAHQGGVRQAEGARGLELLESYGADCLELASAPVVALRSASSQTSEPLHALLGAVAGWQDAGRQVAITARSVTERDRLDALISHRGVAVRPHDGHDDDVSGTVTTLVSPLSRGVELPFENRVLVTEEHVFGRRRPRAPRKRLAAALSDLSELSPGDYVLHVEHGVGRYEGLGHRIVEGNRVDLMEVSYQGGDKLFLPVYRLGQIQKHADAERQLSLDKLGGHSFRRTKSKAKKRVKQLAENLFKLHVERSAVRRPAIAPLGDDYQAFEAAFPFEETSDQKAAILDVLDDLAADTVMDRVVSGDVGFGKTEVALRAAFLNVMESRQVALLCPTTVLAAQHYKTFVERFSSYPVTVKSLSRFQKKQEELATVQGLRDGRVDIVVGTHRLLSKDVHFKRLGLLIVDEEHRFGVAHKERLKALRTSVDVLTLSATPIPRTLELALGGLRDLSTISTPPVDRRSVRTIVSRFDESMIEKAVRYELGRGGQVFLVYNRVEGLEQRAGLIKRLVPEARVAMAHGQQSSSRLEREMLGFVEGRTDVLVSTAIVESGLDIPRANTLLIDRADLLGMAQLYQLRGRVGRSSEQAYCYLFVPAPSRMTPEARGRLEAIERYSELGSGMKLAAIDMQQRGSGDLLGPHQSGFLDSVGVQMFCDMLAEATAELRGEEPVSVVDPELSFDVEALIPEEYVSDVGVRLSLYKRFANALEESDVDALAQETEDRFGAPPRETRALVRLMRLKVVLRRIRALGAEASSSRVTIHLRDDTPLDPAALSDFLAAHAARYRLTPSGSLTRHASSEEKFSSGIDHAEQVFAELETSM